MSAEWKSPRMIVVRSGPTADGLGDICISTRSGGAAVAPMQFETKREPIGPIKESAVWVEETPLKSLTWGRRQMATAGYSPEDPLRISTEGNVKKTIDNLHKLFPGQCGDLAAENFSPEWFLLENYAGTTFGDLRSGLANLRRKVDSQRDGQLSFLKANAGSVMDQLNTLMTLHDRYADDVRLAGAAEPMQKLQQSLHESIIESNGLFTDVLHRRDKADATRAALLAISRHRFLFCLPNSVECSARREAYDIVVNDYSRAKNLYGKTEVQIFRRVLDEADQRVLAIRRELHTKIVRMPQAVDQQKKFVKALISLEEQQQNSSVAEQLTHVDPAWDAIEARSHFLELTLKQTFEQFTAKDAAASTAGGHGASAGHASSGSGSGGSSGSAKQRPDPNAQPNRVQFCEEICEIAAEQMPQLWRLGQAYFSGELRGLNEPKPGNFKRIILTAIEQFCAYIRAAILSGSGGGSGTRGNANLFASPTPTTTTITANITWPNNTAAAIAQFVPWLPQCLRYLRLAYGTLIGLDLPGEVLDIVQKCIEQTRLYCLQSIFRKTVDKVRALERCETWRMSVPDFPGATALPALLERRIGEMLAEGYSTCVAPEQRESVLLEPQSEGMREISKRFQDSLDAFTGVVERLAMQRGSDDDDVMGPMMGQFGGGGVSQLIGFPNAATPQKLLNGVSGSSGAVSAASTANNGHESVPFGGVGSGGSGGGDRVWETVFGWEQRLLCCMANCAYAKKVFFGQLGALFERHGYPRPKAAIDAARENVMQLFGQLLDMYVEQKSDPLVGTIEPSMYIGRFQWDAVPHTGKLRPYAHECLDNLVSSIYFLFSK